MKLKRPNSYYVTYYAKMVLFWEYIVVKLMQFNGLQIHSPPSPQASFSPSSDAHPERKFQPVALISVAGRSKYAQDLFRTMLRQHFLSGLRVNADAANSPRPDLGLDKAHQASPRTGAFEPHLLQGLGNNFHFEI